MSSFVGKFRFNKKSNQPSFQKSYLHFFPRLHKRPVQLPALTDSSTSVPTVGWAPEYTDSGGGPPYFRWPVVTSSVYWVLSRSSLILASSGPLVESETFVPCFSRCLYVFITPHRKALLFCNKEKKSQKSFLPTLNYIRVL